MRNKLAIATLLNIFLCIEVFSQASYIPSIVRIYGYKNDQAKVGSGSFVEVNGKPYILTCYHILSGCDKIEVRSNVFGLIEDVEIVAYDNVKDLLLLGYKKVSTLDPKKLPLGNLPKNLSGLKAVSIGHPNNTPDQKFDVGFTSENGTISSIALSDNNGNGIFKIGYEFNIIPVDATIYGGMSGAPVILNSQVIGILSGSINTGGSLGWAIPTNYCLQMSFLTVPLKTGLTLKELQSLKAGNRPIFRSVSIDQNINRLYSPLAELITESESHLENYLDNKSKQEKLYLEITKEIEKISINPNDNALKLSIDKKISDYTVYQATAKDYEKYIQGSMETAMNILTLIKDFETSGDFDIQFIFTDARKKQLDDLAFNAKRLDLEWVNKFNQIKVEYLPTQDYYYSNEFKTFLKAQNNADKVEKEIVRQNMQLLLFYKVLTDLLYEAKGISNN